MSSRRYTGLLGQVQNFISTPYSAAEAYLLHLKVCPEQELRRVYESNWTKEKSFNGPDGGYIQFQLDAEGYIVAAKWLAPKISVAGLPPASFFSLLWEPQGSPHVNCKECERLKRDYKLEMSDRDQQRDNFARSLRQL